MSRQSEILQSLYEKAKVEGLTVEQLFYMSGIGRTLNATCPRGLSSPMDCLECPNGHPLQCHYPQSCKEAHCYHVIAREIETPISRVMVWSNRIERLIRRLKK